MTVKDMRRADAVSLLNVLSQCKVSSVSDKGKRIGLVMMLPGLRRVGEELDALRRDCFGRLSESEARDVIEGWLTETVPMECVQLTEDDLACIVDENSGLSCGQLSLLVELIG